MNAPHPFLDPATARRLPAAARGHAAIASSRPGAPRTIERRLAPRATLFSMGDLVQHTYEVIEGSVILWTVLTDGRRQIVQIVGPGQRFGFAAGAHHKTTAEAVVETRVYVLPIMAQLRSMVQQRQLLAQVLDRVEALEAHAILLGRLTAIERVASFLLSLGAPAQRPSGQIEIFRLAVTRAEIADYLGLTIETVSRNMTKLRERGLITLSPPDIVRLTDVAGLRAILHPVHADPDTERA